MSSFGITPGAEDHFAKSGEALSAETLMKELILQLRLSNLYLSKLVGEEFTELDLESSQREI